MRSERSTQKSIIGIDVGGTKIAGCVIDPQGRIVSTIRRPTVTSSVEATLDSIALVVKELMRASQLDADGVDAIGFGIPGLVDAQTGTGIASVNLGWNNVPVLASLEARLGIRCSIDNDVRVGALGEAYFGAGKGSQDLVYLNIGTGISAVILIDGKFFLGTHGLAGEIGHAVLIPDGPRCKCGGHGCFEAVASGPGIVQRTLEKLQAGTDSSLTALVSEKFHPLTAEQVFEAAAHADPVALETLQEIGTWMAYAIEYLALAYDPEVIVLGGSIALGSPLLFGTIQQVLQELAESSWVFGKAYSRNLVKLSTLGNHAGVLGAAALVAPNLVINPQSLPAGLEGGDFWENH